MLDSVVGLILSVRLALEEHIIIDLMHRPLSMR